MTPPDTRWWTTKEAAEYLQCHEEVLLVHARRGEVPKSGKFGSSWRFRREGLDRWILEGAR